MPFPKAAGGGLSRPVGPGDAKGVGVGGGGREEGGGGREGGGRAWGGRGDGGRKGGWERAVAGLDRPSPVAYAAGMSKHTPPASQVCRSSLSIPPQIPITPSVTRHQSSSATTSSRQADRLGGLIWGLLRAEPRNRPNLILFGTMKFSGYRL